MGVHSASKVHYVHRHTTKGIHNGYITRPLTNLHISPQRSARAQPSRSTIHSGLAATAKDSRRRRTLARTQKGQRTLTHYIRVGTRNYARRHPLTRLRRAPHAAVPTCPAIPIPNPQQCISNCTTATAGSVCSVSCGTGYLGAGQAYTCADTTGTGVLAWQPSGLPTCTQSWVSLAPVRPWSNNAWCPQVRTRKTSFQHI